MSEPNSTIRDIIVRHCHGNSLETAIPGLVLYRSQEPTKPSPTVYEPRFSLVVQGSKKVMLCDTAFNYDASHYLVATVDLPVSGCVIDASPEEPYLALSLSLDPAQIASLLLEMPHGQQECHQACSVCITTSPVTQDILGPVARLVALLDQPADIPILAPMFLRELLYRLIQGKQGGALRQIASADSNLSQINRAIHWIRTHFSEQFDIATVASVAAMSPSSFHRHFRAATTMSPLQYRARIRLQEARRRLMYDGADAAEVGFSVGYDSPSQFSREYRRMFGRPPLRDVNEMKSLSVNDMSLMAESV